MKIKEGKTTHNVGNNKKKKECCVDDIMGVKKITVKSERYPIYMLHDSVIKSYVSLNSDNLKEAMTRDFQTREIYDEIKFKLEEDMKFMGSVLLSMISQYSLEFIDKAKSSNHPESVNEAYTTLKIFSELLVVFGNVWVPHQLKDIDPAKNIIKNKSETIEKMV